MNSSWRGLPQSQDGQCDLQHVIPVRIYGDGAEAQRSLSRFSLWSLQFPWNMFWWKVQRSWITRPRKAKIWSDHSAVPTLPIIKHFWQQGFVAKLQTDFEIHSWHRQQFSAVCQSLPMASMPCPSRKSYLRFTVINSNYSKADARTKCLETLAWSVNCLCAWVLRYMCIYP